MPTSPSQIEYFTELLSFVPSLNFRKMFGEYGLYSGLGENKKFFGMICDSRLFIKSTPSLRKIIDDDGVRAYDGAGDKYWHISEEYLEDPVMLQKLVISSLDFVKK